MIIGILGSSIFLLALLRRTGNVVLVVGFGACSLGSLLLQQVIRSEDAALGFGLLGAVLGTVTLVTKGHPETFLETGDEGAVELAEKYRTQKRAILWCCLPAAMIFGVYWQSL